MKIIPVIDLLDGKVVHAVRGRRGQYQPVHSRLCKNTDPDNIVQAFLGLFPFDTIYIADLNAINHTGNHETTITALIDRNNSVEFWIDRGTSSRHEIDRLHRPAQRHVIGSETGIGPESLSLFRQYFPDIILSLDFLHGQLSGDEALLQQPQSWPDTLVVMDLDRVGSAGGPDVDKLVSVKSRAGSRTLFAAGGIRNSDDLDTLIEAGIDGVLMASALHTGTINRDDLQQVRAKKMPRRAGHHPSNG
ncbi:MAG TPA: HisA/HisF-related TIM barrel protein [Gammaproteobacteria bacterium]|nr:HisA/HisF-related TIM barrel protein [Gammaproteobacteria bacterium]